MERAMSTDKILLEVVGVRQSFARPGAPELVVLDDVHLQLHEGEILGLLGRSGSGKSSLLRIIAGLTQPVAGSVRHAGKPVLGSHDGVALVFQSFALFPWLTVLQNVEFGLEPLGLDDDEMRQRALQAIDLVGLDGFESAYPKELSGGMRQRAGFARALVVRPSVLLLDEPFSALDVLTGESLRSEFLDLWCEARLGIKGVLLVTHNIEEAVMMCDRVLLFSSNPGRVQQEVRIDLLPPRKRTDPGFHGYVEDLYARMTGRGAGPRAEPREGFPGSGTAMLLPDIAIGELTGLLEAVFEQPYRGIGDLRKVAGSLHLEVDDLFPVAEALRLLRFAELERGEIRLTETGRHFVDESVDGRKRLFGQHLVAYVPLAAHILRVLEERESHTAPYLRFLAELEDTMTEQHANETLRAVIGWARYGEVFAYDERLETLSLENP
jgi:NitT/TauT family transport system ATP-binding protein